MMHSGLISILRSNYIYFILCFFYLVAGLALNLIYTQKELFFFINSRNQLWQDTSMPWLTYIGDGLFFIGIIILLLFIKIRHGLAAFSAWLVVSIIVQSGKLIFFTNRPRPWKKWNETENIYIIEGFQPYLSNSFPSGHTASAFCLFTFLALIFPYKKYNWLFFLAALLVSYTRIYLAQHYFIDTYAGALVGILTALVIYYYFYASKREFARLQPWLDRPLHKIKP